MSPWELTASALREPWRLWTGHLLHWDLAHAAVNLGACLLPLVLLPQGSRHRLLKALPWLLPLASLLLLPFLEGRPYRGASALACTLWVAAAFPLARHGRRFEAAVLGGGALIKASYELAMGVHPLASGAGWEGLPMAHAVGALLGLAWGLQSGFRSSPCPPSSSPEEPSPTA
jgi:hypothetical protein